MSESDDLRAGQETAIEWLEGKSQMSDDLARLVSGMPQPLGDVERGFLLTIGNAARAAVARDLAPEQAVAELRKELQPTSLLPPLATSAGAALPPPLPAIDVDEFYRTRREHARAARFRELARSNAEAWGEQQRAFGGGMPRRAADWRGV